MIRAPLARERRRIGKALDGSDPASRATSDGWPTTRFSYARLSAVTTDPSATCAPDAALASLARPPRPRRRAARAEPSAGLVDSQVTAASLGDGAGQPQRSESRNARNFRSVSSARRRDTRRHDAGAGEERRVIAFERRAPRRDRPLAVAGGVHPPDRASVGPPVERFELGDRRPRDRRRSATDRGGRVRAPRPGRERSARGSRSLPSNRVARCQTFAVGLEHRLRVPLEMVAEPPERSGDRLDDDRVLLAVLRRATSASAFARSSSGSPERGAVPASGSNARVASAPSDSDRARADERAGRRPAPRTRTVRLDRAVARCNSRRASSDGRPRRESVRARTTFSRPPSVGCARPPRRRPRRTGSPTGPPELRRTERLVRQLCRSPARGGTALLHRPGGSDRARSTPPRSGAPSRRGTASEAASPRRTAEPRARRERRRRRRSASSAAPEDGLVAG